MSSVVLDTHSAIWYLESSPKLSPPARVAIQTAIAAGVPGFVSKASGIPFIW